MNFGHLITTSLKVSNETRRYGRDAKGIRRKAKWIEAHEQADLTVLEVACATSGPEIVQPPPEIGLWISVIGNRFGLNHTVSLGNISHINRNVTADGHTQFSFLSQIAALTHPGDNGGLFDDDGQMLDIVHTALFDPDGKHP